MESGSTAASSDEAARSPGGTTAVAAAAPTARPYYECVFCKRGFTTAQALGGHMNIHRRDRAKPARLTTESNLAAYPPALPPMSSSGFSMMYYGRHTGAGVDAAEAVSPAGSPIPTELSLFGADDDSHDRDDCLQLGLGRHGSRGDDGELPERKIDLELRLGPRPRH